MTPTEIDFQRGQCFELGAIIDRRILSRLITIPAVKLAQDWANAHILWFGESDGERTMVAYLSNSSDLGDDQWRVEDVNYYATAKEAVEAFQSWVFHTDLDSHVEDEEHKRKLATG